jgi:hypothetical protein
MVSQGTWTIFNSGAALGRFVEAAGQDGWRHAALVWQDQSGAVVAGALAEEFRRYPFLDLERQLKRLAVDEPTRLRLMVALAHGAAVGWRTEPLPRLVRKALA